MKLLGQSPWHSHESTDEVFILLRGQLTVLYKTDTGEEKLVVLVGGELLCIPMRMEHSLLAEEGTEVLLLEGSHDEGNAQ